MSKRFGEFLPIWGKRVAEIATAHLFAQLYTEVFTFRIGAGVGLGNRTANAAVWAELGRTAFIQRSAGRAFYDAHLTTSPFYRFRRRWPAAGTSIAERGGKRKFGREAEAACKAMGLDYYIKDSLRAEMDKP